MKYTKAKIIAQNFWGLFSETPLSFSIVWVVSFAVLFSLLYSLGWVPNTFADDEKTISVDLTETPVVLASDSEDVEIEESIDDAPVRIIIEAIGVDTPIGNPQSRDISALDEELKNGAVHYPGSGDLEDTSNMFLFGHSSYLPSVINEAFQAFNGLQDLKRGDVIRVQSNTKEYIYRVETVSLVKAEDAWVELTDKKKTLTLSTCNTFGSKQDRFVVTSEFLGSYAI